jgi:DNA-binding transcriptional MerR regulator
MVIGMTSERQSGTSRRVGELANAAGLTVRTLHYYEEIGLLVASDRSSAGHRLYLESDVERLYRICLFRRLGLSLGEIMRALDDPEWSLRVALATHLANLDQRLEAEGRLRGHLAGLVDALGPSDPPLTEELLEVLEEMTMLDTIVQRRISILVYSDLESANDYLIRVFGLGPGQLTRDDSGKVVHGEIQVGDGVVWLHPEAPEFGLASPRSLGAASASVAVMVDDVDEHFRHASEHGAQIEYEPVDQPYGYREYSARDCEGGLWSFMKMLD